MTQTVEKQKSPVSILLEAVGQIRGANNEPEIRQKLESGVKYGDGNEWKMMLGDEGEVVLRRRFSRKGDGSMGTYEVVMGERLQISDLNTRGTTNRMCQLGNEGELLFVDGEFGEGEISGLVEEVLSAIENAEPHLRLPSVRIK